MAGLLFFVPAPMPLARRWLVLLTVSAVLHWLLLSWSGLRFSNIGDSLQGARREQAIAVVLRPGAGPPQTPAASPVASAAQTPAAAPEMALGSPPAAAQHQPQAREGKARQPPVSPQRPQAGPLPNLPSAVAAASVANEAASIAPEVTALAPSDAAPLPAVPEAPDTAAAPESAQVVGPQTPAAVPFRADPPPAAELRYDVEGLTKGRKTYGSGRIAWRPSAGSYSVTGEASILFFNVLEFASEGTIEQSGVVPELYREKRFRKPVTNTYFDRENGVVSFSASDAAYPRRGDEQDRASIVWQLASIARGSTDALQAGAGLSFPVAAVRKSEVWSFRVVGEENIDVAGGRISAWHLAKESLAGADDQRIDIWFASGMEWYPVRIRYTEPNGDFLEMSLSTMTALAAD